MNINKKTLFILGIGLIIGLFASPKISEANMPNLCYCLDARYTNIESNKECITHTIQLSANYSYRDKHLKINQADCEAIGSSEFQKICTANEDNYKIVGNTELLKLKNWCTSEVNRIIEPIKSKEKSNNILLIIFHIVLISLISAIAIPNIRIKLKLKYWMTIIGFISPWIFYATNLYPTFESIATIKIILPHILSVISQIIGMYLLDTFLQESSLWQAVTLSIINAMIYFAIFGIKEKSGKIGLRFGILAAITMICLIFIFIGFALGGMG